MSDKKLRAQLTKHIEGGEAFLPIDKFINDIPYDKLGIVADGLPYSLWQQFYHLQFAQKDIVEFCTNPDYQKVKWPDDYWPKEPSPADEQEWLLTRNSFFAERNRFMDLIGDEKNDLYKPFPHGTGQNLLREAFLIVEHNAYHTGQMIVIMRSIGIY